jgi:streptogramin lyase
MPLALAVDENALWVRTVGDGLVVRLDPNTARVTSTIEVTYPLGRNGLDHIALLGGSLWVAGVSLQRIDEASNRVSGTIDVEATSVTAGFGSLWITDLQGHVERINPSG